MTDFDPVRRLKEWAAEYPLKAHGGAVCAVVGGGWVLFPRTLWQLSTGHLLAFGVVHAVGMLAWVIHWEIREQRLQGWLLRPGHGFRWFVPIDRHHTLNGFGEGGRGWWEWTDGLPIIRRKSAAEVLDELEDVRA